MHVVEAKTRKTCRKKCSARPPITGEKSYSCIFCNYFHVSDARARLARARARSSLSIISIDTLPPRTYSASPGVVVPRSFVVTRDGCAGKNGVKSAESVGRRVTSARRRAWACRPPTGSRPKACLRRTVPEIYRLNSERFDLSTDFRTIFLRRIFDLDAIFLRSFLSSALYVCLILLFLFSFVWMVSALC